LEKEREREKQRGRERWRGRVDDICSSRGEG